MPKNVNKHEVLEPEKYYHVYNRAVGNELLFRDEDDYSYFLNKIERFILPVADLISYCLIPNHFHLFLRTKDELSIKTNLKLVDQEQIFYRLNQAFSNFFNSYTKSFNLRHTRKGKLFMLPYKRIVIEDDSYFISIVNYVHRNPIHHGLVEAHSEWKYSSYNAYLSKDKTKLSRDMDLGFFRDLNDFIRFHQENSLKEGSEKYLLE